MEHRLASMPSAPYQREGQNNMPHRRTVDEMRRALPAGATGFAMFRTASGGNANGFCRFVDRDGSRVARYHDTDILAVTPAGDVRVTFGGWHTISTRERFNAAAREFGLPLRAVSVGKADVTGFGVAPAGRYPGKVLWKMAEHDTLHITAAEILAD